MNSLSAFRLYVVTASDSGAERLVRAATKSRALRHACTARIANQADLERLFAAGIKPEGEPSLARVRAPVKLART